MSIDTFVIHAKNQHCCENLKLITKHYFPKDDLIKNNSKLQRMCAECTGVCYIINW